MEDNIQRIFTILLSVVILFLLPLYMAFEKKDDISYALALRITTNFVDNVLNSGYIDQDMYNEFLNELNVTSNVYSVKLIHKSKKYYPVIIAEKNKSNIRYDYWINRNEYNQYKSSIENGGEIKYGNNLKKLTNDDKYTLSYQMQEELFYTNHILNYIESLDIESLGNYTMNAGDEFSIIVKNENTTIATVLFNSLTFGANSGNNTKVYINYGGYIKNGG